MSYRVDLIEGNIAKCFGFTRGDKAFEKFVEGVSNAYDEVRIFQFDGGGRSAILLATFTFNRKRNFHGFQKEESDKARVDRSAETQIQAGA